MNDSVLIKTGIVGAVIAAICCATAAVNKTTAET